MRLVILHICIRLISRHICYAFDVVTPIIITNSDEYELKKATKGAVKSGAAILAIVKKEV